MNQVAFRLLTSAVLTALPTSSLLLTSQQIQAQSYSCSDVALGNNTVERDQGYTQNNNGSGSQNNVQKVSQNNSSKNNDLNAQASNTNISGSESINNSGSSASSNASANS
ncbi:hypothetical protein [Nostoc sp.]|uniref:hypothetical protein n=1 Tax=Nostoc sp. TaxID=1180 RepID=UPI002FF6534A